MEPQWNISENKTLIEKKKYATWFPGEQIDFFGKLSFFRIDWSSRFPQKQTSLLTQSR